MKNKIKALKDKYTHYEYIARRNLLTAIKDKEIVMETTTRDLCKQFIMELDKILNP